MSSPSLTGYSPNNPRRYLGPNVGIETIVTRNREPTGADIKQPNTGKYYPFGTLWLVGENPTTGTRGDMWYLAYIDSNIAVWSRFAASYSKSTWTPTIDGSTPGTTIYGVQYGSYVEFEALVQLDFTVTAASATGTGALLIGNLPFPMNPASNANIVGSVYFFGQCTWPVGTTTVALVGQPTISRTELLVYATGSGVNASPVQIANQVWNIQGSIVYQV